LHEERLVKRQKLQDDHRCRARSQTVTHAAILNNSIAGGAGLHREIDHQPPADSHLQQREAILKGLRPHRVQVIDSRSAGSGPIFDLHLIPDTNLTVFARTTSHFPRIAFYVGASDWLLQQHPQSRFDLPGSTNFRSSTPRITALECTNRDSGTFVLFCDDGGSWSVEAIEYAEAEEYREDETAGPVGDDRDQRRLQIRHGPTGEFMYTAFWDAKFQPGVSAPSFAVAGSHDVTFVDMAEWSARKTVEVSLPSAEEMEARILSWLDPRVVSIAMVPFAGAAPTHAMGYRGPPPRPDQKTGRRAKQRPVPDRQLRSEVRLWDIRTRDSSSRIVPSSRLTGLSSIPLASTSFSASTQEPPNPYCLLTTSTSGISMHDLRFTSKQSTTGTTRPLWTAAHATQIPRLPLAVHAGLDVVAAVDREGVVQCYSLANGTRVGSLHCEVEDRAYGWSDSSLGVPRWQEDSRGAPYLCVGGNKGWVYSWKW
jgi:hypothetical protein